MTPPQRRIALVAAAGEPRTALAEYLANAGFVVHTCSELGIPTAFAALVVLDRPEPSGAALVAPVRRWLALGKQRIVVVTIKPTALKDLLAAHGERLRVLPAPAFGWDVVDALRATPTPDPRGA